MSDARIIESMGLSFKLTAREAEVLYWVLKGRINHGIGGILGASPATVKTHLKRAFAKLGGGDTHGGDHGDEPDPAAAPAV